ncbi:UDP-N-acetylglucosamine 2-epimerase (non-hydrolyzing) [Tessaracoccus sp. OS52]|uniref:non-hydrolyzing UDP-N-acetylglucosamine 2-epimerase n=1 Tax=Tessaracoccus sp. OS52 TaxID=2886691 RepID=UPI001D110BF0|nr:UDP-N-acetylglucosamine 2-epimerase (non-hydrolyzing) [Tessaracoccus sp. OS52]MCC2594545.1 UDP-N-acetylglucosamine 2-epimerase (non-hydrolyzing) [Tessaracoccus sp. OS52]
MKQVMVIYGTRPEAVKMAPLIKALEASEVLTPVVVSTGQHREMMDQVNEWFGIEPDLDLKVFKDGQSLTELASRILDGLPKVWEEYHPDAVVVQGDTTTVAIAAIACFYNQIPVVHLEAGLRSGDIMSPFPEEANRKLAGQVTSLHLAPTTTSRDNLLREAIDPGIIAVVGNTVIDALEWTAAHDVEFSDPRLAAEAAAGRRMVLLTTHRRENWGEPMAHIGLAVAELARRFPEYLFVFPAHKNPLVRAAIVPLVADIENVAVVEPLDYPQFVHAQKWADIILTDSGGVQEEAPSFGKPVLVLRDNTERPEAVVAGTVRLVGTDKDRIVAATAELIDDREAYARMSHAVNPYGDGHAAERSVAAIAELLGVGQRLPDFGTQEQ